MKLVHTPSLFERILKADGTQARINGWPYSWRVRGHDKLMYKTLRKAGLGTMCRYCGKVIDTAIWHVDCEFCGSDDTASPYYC